MKQEVLNILLGICAMTFIGFLIYISHMISQRTIREKFNGMLHVDYQAVSFEEEFRYNKKLDELVYGIMLKTNAANVSIARLHNNGYWNNGRSMRKFTITTEKFRNDHSIMREYKDVLTSRYATAMDFLFYHGEYWISDIEKGDDSSLCRDLAKCNFLATKMILIKQADGERTAEAFVWLNFDKRTVLTTEQSDYVKDLRFEILGYLNMTKKS